MEARAGRMSPLPERIGRSRLIREVSVLYVSGGVSTLGEALLTSTDGGNTWTPVSDKYDWSNDWYKSTDGGVTFADTSLLEQCSSSCNVNQFAVARALVNVSAASFQSGPEAPESIVSAFGFDLANTSLPATSLPLPTNLGGTTVTVVDSTGTSRLAPQFYVSPGQVNYEIPAGTALGAAVIRVKSGDGTVSSAPVEIAAVAPDLFTLNATGLVAAYALQVLNGNQTYENVYQLGPSNAVAPLPINLGLAGTRYTCFFTARVCAVRAKY